MREFLKHFASPSSERRGAPFWAWNAELDEAELIRQIHIFKEMGLGGFFMHARVGLATEYLGEKWFSCIRTCIEEAKKCGMKAYLYDEDRWPSGAAGGIVTKDDRFKMKSLHWEFADDAASLTDKGNTLGIFVFAGDKKERVMTAYRKVSDPASEKLADGEAFLRIFWEYKECTTWFNGATYLDTMDPEAVRKFIDSTYEAYFRRFAGEFGSSVPAIFTDEPNYMLFSQNTLPWTVALPERFRELCGYDLLERLPELILNRPGIPPCRVRRDFFNVAAMLFDLAFGKLIGDWCEKHNIKLTGHILGEDSLTSQTVAVGAAMRFYENMQMPGIDLLMEIWDIFVTTKQCVSAARQFGKKERLSEIYGVTGWDFPLAGHKALGDWQFALGINFRCQHLSYYSMEGEAKRDYPASIFYQSPWYKKYPFVEDYFARLGTVLTGADEIRELLVIHPIESYWSTYLPFEAILPSDRPAYDKAFEHLSCKLLEENLDFDYGDEDILSRIASVKGRTLQVGKADYRAVLIPELLTIRGTTLKLLREFAASGGQVCYIGAPPEYVDVVKSDEAKRVFTECFRPVSMDDCAEKLSPVARRISMRDAAGKEVRPLLGFFGKQGDFHTLFVCNFGEEFPANTLADPHRVLARNKAFDHVEISIRMDEEGKVFELDPLTGAVYPVDFVHKEGAYRFAASFAARQSRLFVVTDSMRADAVSIRPPEKFLPAAALPSEKWAVTPDEYNALVLDHADVYIDGELKFRKKFILHADDELRKSLGGNRRGEAMCQPYARKKSDDRHLDLRLTYSFEIETVPDKVLLAVERPEIYRISINGKTLDNRADGWWVDRSIKTLPIPGGVLETGVNTIEMSCRYHLDLPGLENIYLLGYFGVNDADVITGMPEFLDCTDWCAQGFKYFSGSMTYRRKLTDLPPTGDVYLRIPSWRGSIMGIRVNDSEETLVAWPPERVKLPGALRRDGSDELQITVCSHRRNSFGPFYLKEKWTCWSGSRSFSEYETDGVKQVVECGLLAAPVLEVEA